VPSGIKQHIIGICGLAGAGKDTIGDILQTHAGFRRLAFADALRGEICNAFRVEPLTLTRRETKELPMCELALGKGPTEFAAMVLMAEESAGVPATRGAFRAWLEEPRSPRQILQWWGTQYRRAIDPDYWVRQLTAKLEYHMDEGERHFVITDCRFDNEVFALRARGAAIWRVVRLGKQPQDTHESATNGSQFEPDVVILNDGDILQLRQKVLGEFWAVDAGLEHVNVRIAA
jgi:hypothetical protein